MARKQRLVWIGSVVPEDFYKKLCSMGYKNQQASRIAQLNIVNGLEAHYGVPFDFVSGPALPAYPKFPEMRVKPYTWENENGSKGTFASYLNLEYINRVFKGGAMEKAAKQLIASYDKDDLVTVYVNSPHTPFIRAGIEVKKQFPQAKLVLIIPDLPQFMETQINPVKKFLKNFDISYMLGLLKQFDYFIPYSKHMVTYLHLNPERCVTMEGCVSSDGDAYKKSEEKLPFTFMYSGTADIRFGLKMLVDAFGQIEDTNTALIITGKGDAAAYIEEAEKKDKRIHYYGFVDDYSKVKQMQADADVMMNMRLPSEEASMYCFPSKLFEYMKTGNPVLSFRIGGIPDEYFEHLIPIEEESVTAVKTAMLEAMKMPKESRLNFGKKAKEFIMMQKNTARQTKLIYDLVEGEK